MSLLRPFAFLLLVMSVVPIRGGEAQKQRALAALTAAGLKWEESSHAITASDRAEAKLKDLAAVESAMRELQPRSLDLSSCAVLKNVEGLRGLLSLEKIQLSACPALRSVDGISASDRTKKIYLFQSVNISPESLDALAHRFPACYLVLPDGTGLNPPRDK